jgi:hypothetical protein
VRWQRLPPEQIRVAVTVEVLDREGPVAAGRSPEWQCRPLVRAAQMEFDVVL